MSKKGGKGQKKGDDEGPDPNRVNTALKNECDMLRRQIVTEQERQDKAESNKEEYRDRIIELDSEFEEERDKTKKIVDDMKRQYKEMQDELMQKINSLELKVSTHEKEIEEKDEEITKLDKEIKEE
mgnify:CR=1 FL=1